MRSSPGPLANGPCASHGRACVGTTTRSDGIAVVSPAGLGWRSPSRLPRACNSAGGNTRNFRRLSDLTSPLGGRDLLPTRSNARHRRRRTALRRAHPLARRILRARRPRPAGPAALRSPHLERQGVHAAGQPAGVQFAAAATRAASSCSLNAIAPTASPAGFPMPMAVARQRDGIGAHRLPLGLGPAPHHQPVRRVSHKAHA